MDEKEIRTYETVKVYRGMLLYNFPSFYVTTNKAVRSDIKREIKRHYDLNRLFDDLSIRSSRRT